MSNYKKGDWCDVVDSLYWKFMEDNIDFFRSNPRLSIIPRSLDKMKPERKKKIFKRLIISLKLLQNEKKYRRKDLSSL